MNNVKKIYNILSSRVSIEEKASNLQDLVITHKNLRYLVLIYCLYVFPNSNLSRNSKLTRKEVVKRFKANCGKNYRQKITNLVTYKYTNIEIKFDINKPENIKLKPIKYVDMDNFSTDVKTNNLINLQKDTSIEIDYSVPWDNRVLTFQPMIDDYGFLNRLKMGGTNTVDDNSRINKWKVDAISSTNDDNVKVDLYPIEVVKSKLTLNKEQKEAIKCNDDCRLVIAAAGSGKTRVLTERVIDLINNKDADPSRILLLTFTVKAGEEMRERVSRKLSSSVASEINCGTFHSWAHRILRRNPSIADVHKDFSILDSNDSMEVWIKCAQLINPGENIQTVKSLFSIYSLMRNKNIPLKNAIKQKYLKANAKHIKQLETLGGKVIKKYIDYKHKYSMLDFDDLLDKVESKLRQSSLCRMKVSNLYDYILVDELQDCNGPQLSILKSLVLGNKENRKRDSSIGKLSLFACGDEAQCWEGNQVVKVERDKICSVLVKDLKVGDKVNCLINGNLTYAPITNLSSFKVKAYIKVSTENYSIKVSPNHRFFSYNGSEFVENKCLIFNSSTTSSITCWVNDTAVNFNNYKIAYKYIRHFIKNVPEYLRICSSILKCRSTLGLSLFDKIPVINDNVVYLEPVTGIQIVNEECDMYDIEVAQAGNVVVERIISHNSIYGFRGADYQNMIDFPETFNSKVSMLLTNYRSTQEILDLANHIGNNFTTTRWKKQMVGTYHGPKPYYVRPADDTLQAEFVADTIKNMISKKMNGRDIAVLFRSNSASIPIEAALSARMIYFEKRGGQALLDMAHIKDIFAFLKATFYHEDIIGWSRMLELHPGIGVQTSELIYTRVFENNISVLSKLSDFGIKKDLTQLYKLIRNIRKNNKSPEVAIQLIVDYITPFMVKSYGEQGWKKRQSSIRSLIDIASKSSSIKKMLIDFSLNANSQAQKTDEEADKKQGGKVVLSTFHACVAGDTLVETPMGISYIKNIEPEDEINTPSGYKKYINYVKYENTPVKSITTLCGYKLTGTHNHGVTVWSNEENQYIRKNIDQLQVGDICRLKTNTSSYYDEKSHRKIVFYYLKDFVYEQICNINDLFEFVGVLLGKGYLYKDKIHIFVDSHQQQLVTRITNLIRNNFGTDEFFIVENPNHYRIDIEDFVLNKFLITNFKQCFNKDKDIPSVILRGSKSHLKSFITGFSSCINVESSLERIKAFTFVHSYEVLRKIQFLLLKFDLISSLNSGINKKTNKLKYVLILSKSDPYKFHKEFLNGSAYDFDYGNREWNTEEIRYVPFSIVDTLTIKKYFTDEELNNITKYNNISTNKVRELLTYDIDETLKKKLRNRLKYVYFPITTIEDNICDTYCVEVPEYNRFLQNGFDAWNSKGLEYNNVFIVNCVEGKLPSQWFLYEGKPPKTINIKKDDPKRVDEERRLFYVAVTRAKHNLVIISPMTYNEYEDYKNLGVIKDSHNMESRFITEIDNVDDLVQVVMPPEKEYKSRTIKKIVDEYE